MKILKTRDVKTPTRANTKDAGIDFYIPNDFKAITLHPHEDILIPAGVKVCIPEGHALIAFNKSGVATKRKLVIGAEVIDETYQGELHLHLINYSSIPQLIFPGEKITQLICLPINYVNIEEVTSEADLYNGITTERGEGGFGSTGTN